ncbi:hypothetical protein NE237_029128 [Protea cynaroides]|uniref:RING-type domain-containing protein n=1 Tax=Protea cynaroides TaxID=273540 RepID=A0A9Q0GQL5_9MAGN|nr:hypothetical protein NE237_029128 [Protea cynaroides]
MGNGSIWDNPMDNLNSPENSSLKEIETCEICIEPIMTQEMKFANNKRQCVHPFCTDCIAKYIQVKVEERLAKLPCPSLNCEELLVLSHTVKSSRLDCSRNGVIFFVNLQLCGVLFCYDCGKVKVNCSVVGLHKVKGNPAVATMLAISVVLDCAFVPILCVKEVSEKPEGDGAEGRQED